MMHSVRNPHAYGFNLHFIVYNKLKLEKLSYNIQFYFYMFDTIAFCKQLIFYAFWFINVKLICFLPISERKKK